MNLSGRIVKKAEESMKLDRIVFSYALKQTDTWNIPVDTSIVLASLTRFKKDVDCGEEENLAMVKELANHYEEDFYNEELCHLNWQGIGFIFQLKKEGYTIPDMVVNAVAKKVGLWQSLEEELFKAGKINLQSSIKISLDEEGSPEWFDLALGKIGNRRLEPNEFRYFLTAIQGNTIKKAEKLIEEVLERRQ